MRLVGWRGGEAKEAHSTALPGLSFCFIGSRIDFVFVAVKNLVKSGNLPKIISLHLFFLFLVLYNRHIQKYTHMLFLKCDACITRKLLLNQITSWIPSKTKSFLSVCVMHIFIWIHSIKLLNCLKGTRTVIIRKWIRMKIMMCIFHD